MRCAALVSSGSKNPFVNGPSCSQAACTVQLLVFWNTLQQVCMLLNALACNLSVTVLLEQVWRPQAPLSSYVSAGSGETSPGLGLRQA